MTELLDGVAEVRLDQRTGALRAVRLSGRWHPVSRVASRWVVETDWWRIPVRRQYFRLLLGVGGGERRRSGVREGEEGGRPVMPAVDEGRGGECVELYRDLETGVWHWSRRYD